MDQFKQKLILQQISEAHTDKELYVIATLLDELMYVESDNTNLLVFFNNNLRNALLFYECFSQLVHKLHSVLSYYDGVLRMLYKVVKDHYGPV